MNEQDTVQPISDCVFGHTNVDPNFSRLMISANRKYFQNTVFRKKLIQQKRQVPYEKNKLTQKFNVTAK
jgi:hypothetical protein